MELIHGAAASAAAGDAHTLACPRGPGTMRLAPPVPQLVNAASLMRFTAFILIGRSARKARAEAGRGGNCALCIIAAG